MQRSAALFPDGHRFVHHIAAVGGERFDGFAIAHCDGRVNVVLRALLEQALNDNPERTWDSVVMEIAGSE